MAIIFRQSVEMGAFIANLKIQTVPKNPKRPDGFKVNFIQINTENFELALLVDSHHPFGYHMHPEPSGAIGSRWTL